MYTVWDHPRINGSDEKLWQSSWKFLRKCRLRWMHDVLPAVHYTTIIQGWKWWQLSWKFLRKCRLAAWGYDGALQLPTLTIHYVCPLILMDHWWLVSNGMLWIWLSRIVPGSLILIDARSWTGVWRPIPTNYRPTNLTTITQMALHIKTIEVSRGTGI